jgi:hypothetical protein
VWCLRAAAVPTCAAQMCERVCDLTVQGQRRLELFGEDHNIRPGWVTVGKDLSGSNFNPQVLSYVFSNACSHLAAGMRVRHAALSSSRSDCSCCCRQPSRHSIAAPVTA